MPIESAPFTRRQAIRIAGATGFVLLAGPRALAGAGSGAGAGATATARAAAACVLAPNLEIGPYFVDVKLNRSNVLANSDGSSKQAGVPLKLNLQILNATSCAAISGAQVDMWQANADGVYSDESNQSTLNQTWLRGYQLTDANGLATFTTIFPGWYSGRTPHIHLMVRTFSGTKVAYEWTTQLLFEQTDIDTTLTKQAPYDERSKPEPDTSNSSDHVYSTMVSDEASGHSAMVLALSGSAASGYTASMNIAVDLTDGGGTGSSGGGPNGGGPGQTPTTTTAVGASLTSCTVARTASGLRKATVKVAATEAVSVLARVVRNGHLLGQSRLSARTSGARTLHLGIAKTAAAGKATLRLTFTNAAGKTKTVTKTIHIPAGSAP